VPGGITLVSESGIYTREQVRRLEDGGVDAILVGESLLYSDDIQAKIRELIGLG
jgi:indole-3-glycerol phosphate synthase